MDKARKKTIKRVISLICIVAVVALLAAMPLIARQEPEKEGSQASILSGTAETGSIDRELMGGGTLTQADPVSLTIPSAVKLKEFLVSNGETVTAGTAVATVDRVSVMTAIVSLQETLDHLSEEIEEAGDTEEERSVSALAGGTVKVLYVQEGDSVQEAMLAHGTLAVLSLDGLMAVDMETESTLSAASEVTVTLSDGTAVTGRVEKNLLGTMTVTVEDDAYAVGETVEVSDGEGTVLGSGELYIYSPWNATAYAGTVDSVEVEEGDDTDPGDTLLVLTDVGNSAAYGQLVAQRSAYEELMSELFQMYETEVVTAPCDGQISGIDTEGPQLMAASQEESYGIVFLSNTTVIRQVSEPETAQPAATEPASTESGEGQTPGTQSGTANPGGTAAGGTEGATGTTDGTVSGEMGGFGGGVTGGMSGGMSGFGGSMSGFGGYGGSSGMTTTETEPEFELFSTEVTEIGAVTPLDTMELEITVDEMDVTALELGMLAEIRLDALGGEKTTAVITDIGNTGTGNGGNSKFTVTLSLERGENMLPGMTAAATIVLSTVSEILTVPAAALVEEGNRTLIYTGYDEENQALVDPVAVEVGVSDGENVELLSGLTKGQTYYYAYYDTPEISFTPDFGGAGFFGR